MPCTDTRSGNTDKQQEKPRGALNTTVRCYHLSARILTFSNKTLTPHRVAANGDVANKISTYMIAVLARRHRVPFYVAAPDRGKIAELFG